ncbi:pollen-specific leucine-rich repeat extensin 1 isoform X2 [Labeo rohita]|uniref:Pollen-specific leucine-rich repeat extensin 1 isoform X2 n=1 Tax=Labeo rohita TaxID=84645 RepID=A0A498MAG0_LABRO|nr:pollen-specific leucine-rich repeat extensin 1 isoform X2 [Labeo rohita]
MPQMAQQCAAQELAAVEKLSEAPLMKAATRFKPLPPVTKPPMCPQKPAPAPEEVTLPGTPLQVGPPSVSEHFTLPATRFKPFLPVTKQPMHPQKPAPAPEEVTLPGTPLQVDPPKPLVVPPRPTPAPDELFRSLRCSQVSPPKRLVVPPSPTPTPEEVVALQCSSDEVCPSSLLKPQPATSSLFELPPQLMLIDIEDEENEYVEYTGKTIETCDLLKSERPRLLQAKMNPRMPAWLESDSEVLEEMWDVTGGQANNNTWRPLSFVDSGSNTFVGRTVNT